MTVGSQSRMVKTETRLSISAYNWLTDLPTYLIHAKVKQMRNDTDRSTAWSASFAILPCDSASVASLRYNTTKWE